MATEDRTRHDRLRGLLPRSYAVDPETSALGVVLEVLADELRDADFAIERALRDKWLATAAGPRRAVQVAVPDRWVLDERVPAILREAAILDAKATQLRVARVLAPEPRGPVRALSQSPRVLVGERLVAPEPADFADEAAMLARLQTLLAPLGIATLAQAPSASTLTAKGDPPAPDEPDLRVKRLWARWLLPGEAFEAAIAPAGAFIAVVIVRGPLDDSSYRSAVDQILSDSLGFSGASSPALPKVSMVRPPEPLEHLGAALDLRRQPWETDAEAYRSRVRILAPMLTEGLATPKVMLAAVLTSLHAEPCPITERPDPDSTRGYGLPPKSLSRCAVCRGGGTPPPGSTCPLRDAATMQATITDNPRTRATLVRSRLEPYAEGGGRSLRVRNDSLFSARPEIILRVPEDADPGTRVVPSFRSSTTGDEVVVPTILGPGDELTVRPASDHDPALPRHQQFWVDPPGGEAQLPPRVWIRRGSAGGGGFETVANTLFAAGPRFDQVRYSDAADPALFDEGSYDNVYLDEPAPTSTPTLTHFADTQLRITSPRLQPGTNDWTYQPLAKAALASLLTDYEEEPEYAALALGLDLEAEPDFEAANTKVALELRWWTRPPARFRVRVPLVPAVIAAMGAGADVYMRAMIERVRPAGVYPLIDFALPPIVEALEPSVSFEGLDLRAFPSVEPEIQLDLAATFSEALEPSDASAFVGVHNVTLFDHSLFTDQGADLGIFDATRFDHSLLSGQDSNLGPLLNHSSFNEATFADQPVGEWDGSPTFNNAVFG